VMTALPMAVIALFFNQVDRNPSSGLGVQPQQINWRRCSIKILGLILTLLVIAFGYWVFPEYGMDYYVQVGRIFYLLTPAFLIIAVPYVLWVDRRMAQPEDGYWFCGLFFLGRWHRVDWKSLSEYALGWLVKGFFLPIMLAQAADSLQKLNQNGLALGQFEPFYTTSLNLLFTIDTVFGVVGYCLTLRLLDAHIRTTEPTALGWMAALSCYQPFSTMIDFFTSGFMARAIGKPGSSHILSFL
jgi:hypothetical protein